MRNLSIVTGVGNRSQRHPIPTTSSAKNVLAILHLLRDLSAEQWAYLAINRRRVDDDMIPAKLLSMR